MARPNKAKARNKARSLPKTHQASPYNHLTMQQEARNTEGRHSWKVGQNLRHQAVHFVSAGGLEPDQENVFEPAEDPTSLDEQTTAKAENAIPAEHDNRPSLVDMAGEPLRSEKTPERSFSSHKTSPCDSSEDEIVFRGRQQGKNSFRHHHGTTEYQCLPYTSPRAPENSRGFSSARECPTRGRNRSKSSAPSHARTALSSGNRMSMINCDFISLNHRSARGKSRAESSDEDHDMLADYIANIDQDYGESSDDEPDDSDDLRPEAVVETPLDENISRLDNVPDTEKPAMSSYSPPAVTVDEESLDVPLTEPYVTANRALYNEGPHSFEDSDSDSTYECAKGSPPDHESPEEILALLYETKPKSPWNATKGYTSATAFADTLESDPYYSLDFMDRVVAQKKKGKGRQHALDMVFSDDEFGQHLEQAWHNDRQKKKARKLRREELRSQGLLGRGVTYPDLKQKYSTEMGLDDLKTELRLFLLSPKNSLALPPMPKHRRKLVHDLANPLSLKSQSRGKGSSRFTVLNKTSKTPNYSQKTISRVDQVFLQGRFTHRAIKYWDPSANKPKRHGTRRLEKSATYADGDVVGGSAPEIGAENKGRAMLERMGWSMGTALGAGDNKGILLPVAHVVKNSKTGLG